MKKQDTQEIKNMPFFLKCDKETYEFFPKSEKSTALLELIEKHDTEHPFIQKNILETHRKNIEDKIGPFVLNNIGFVATNNFRQWFAYLCKKSEYF